MLEDCVLDVTYAFFFAHFDSKIFLNIRGHQNQRQTGKVYLNSRQTKRQEYDERRRWIPAKPTPRRRGERGASW